jgi:hypothetical protein
MPPGNPRERIDKGSKIKKFLKGRAVNKKYYPHHCHENHPRRQQLHQLLVVQESGIPSHVPLLLFLKFPNVDLLILGQHFRKP